MGYKYVFGPVLSGRLGRSLGLDLLGDRVCSMDCVYCEVGATRRLTTERRAYVPARDILDELAAWKGEGHPQPDAITLGGLGEPCLNADMGAVIRGVRELFPDVAVAVLTNSTMLTDPDVRRDLALADVVLPSMDSLVPTEFAAVNRPCESLTPEGVAQGLLEFARDFDGKIFLEILLAGGFNDSEENLARLKEFCARLKPDRVDVVTMTRPGTARTAKPVEDTVLAKWREALGAGRSRTSDTRSAEGAEASPEQLREAIQSSLARRPQTVLQLAKALKARPEAVREAVDALKASGKVGERVLDGTSFYHGPGHKWDD